MESSSPLQSIFIGEQGGVRFMRFGGTQAGWQGAMWIKKPNRLYFGYQQAFALFVTFLPQVERFLAIGVGTGTAISHIFRIYPHAHIVGVELDKAVIQAAVRHFDLPVDPRVQLIESSAQEHVPKMTETFDLIFQDVFFHEETPDVLLTPMYLQSLSDRLMVGGVLAINVIMVPSTSRHAAFARLCEHLQSWIGPVYYIPLGLSPMWDQNIVIFAWKEPQKQISLKKARRRARKYILDHPKIFGWRARRLVHLFSQWESGL